MKSTRTLRRWPTLYKKSTSGSGKITQWSIWVEGATIHTETGYVGFKMKYSSDTIKAGKNLGKKNATTPETQAESEAASLYQKYLDKKYTKDPGGEDGVENLLPTPMLAHNYDDHSKKIQWPAMVQPKYNGGRCLAQANVLSSRTGEIFSQLPTISKEVKSLFATIKAINPTLRLIMDGELYNHDYRDDLEKIMSTIRRSKEISPLESKMKYYIYDVITDYAEDTFQRRVNILNNLAAKDSWEHIVFVPTYLVQNEAELKALHKSFLKEGYEGSMIRNIDGIYALDKRSYDLQKYKPFQESEFRIVGTTGEGSGRLQGAIGSFVLEVDDEHGKRTFKCKLAGKNITEFLQKAYKDPSLWKGKWMRVQYFTLTKANRVPAQPRGIEIRDIE